jgi:hypothetical protein
VASSALIRGPLFSAALLFATAAALAAQTVTSAAENVGRTAVAARREGVVRIDGRLDEPAWERAAPLTEFRQTQPVEGVPASERSEIRILYDDEAVYVGARMHDSRGAAGVRGRLARRDQLLTLQGDNGTGAPSVTSDILVLHFDTFHDKLGESVFLINPLGVKGDAISIGGSNLDPAWDPVWDGTARVDSLGWTAEVRIPLSQLRFTGAADQSWGLQVERFIDRLNEWDVWAFWRRAEAGGPVKYGSLGGLTLASHPRSLELLPYVLTGGRFDAPEVGDPFHSWSDVDYRVGADVRYLLTSNLTLDATINPDFGQVEADPAVVNLSAFETFFPEKRPFFVAGAGAFSFGGFSCYFCSNVSSLSVFYSRRIGRQPQLGDYIHDLADFEDVPDATTILGAAKITGRTQKGYTVGILDAVTEREVARYRIDLGQPTQRQSVEPLTNYFVGRLKRDFNSGNTVIGGIVTSTARRLDDQLLRDSLRAHGEAVGIDFRHAWHDQTYSVRSQLAISNVGGSAPAIVRTMQSSAHYFQRPDRSETSDGLFSVRYDPNAASLRGYGFYARVAKEAGSWLWEAADNVRSPGFEVNDLAFQSRADYNWMSSNLVRQWTVPGQWYRNIFTSVGGQQQFNYEGVRTDLQGQAFFGMQFLNYWNWRSYYIHHPVVFDDRATRGGPIVKRPGFNDLGFGLTSDNRRQVVLGINGEWATGVGERNSSLYVTPSATVKLGPNANVDFTPTYSHSRGTQYVTTVDDATATDFFGHRYVFSQIDQTSLSLDTRLNVTFSPTLTLELYAQPFFASGDYHDFEEFTRPRALEKVVYGRDIGTVTAQRDAEGAIESYTVDPDGSGPAAPFTFDNPSFSKRSLLGNAVARWEYRPGSTIFLVWQHSRSGQTVDGTFDLRRDRALLLGDRPVNVFQLKVNYWLGI